MINAEKVNSKEAITATAPPPAAVAVAEKKCDERFAYIERWVQCGSCTHTSKTKKGDDCE